VLKPCLGRSDVHRQLAAALARSRWVTVVGPPGCGKTLLARHVLDRDGRVVWVDAGRVRSLSGLVATSLEVLLPEPAPGENPADALTRTLDSSPAVLVLDGLDLDATGVAPFLQTLVATTTQPRLLVTSLAIAGHPDEDVVRVGPLPLPGPAGPLSGPAVELFLSRLQAAGGSRADAAQRDLDVRRLLAATGGLPLLVEQAAVQAALVGLPNATPTGSLAEAVQASYDLLESAEQRCFRQLAQLPCPVSLDVVAAVVGADRTAAGGLVARLVRRSLVEVLPDDRLDLLAPIREHARQLATEEDARTATSGLLRWADGAAPDHENYGAADQPWLKDLAAMRHAVRAACADDRTRDLGYGLANRVFSSLYTSMRAREALEILESALASGDGPAAIGAQVARRAGIAASEVRGTYEGLWLLDRADEHASAAERPEDQLARTASIRAEMHLDAGDLRRAEHEARRAVALDPDGSIVRQATRTLADVQVSSGRFEEAARAAAEAVPTTEANDERWISLSARTLLARIALEQGRVAEAIAAARAVVREARTLAEDRVGLLAELLLREADGGWEPSQVDRESLPWAVRLPVLAQDARELLRAGEVRRAAGLAADVVALADSARLGRDGVEARLLLGRALIAGGDPAQAATTFVTALQDAAAMPMPLRMADALDGLATVADQQDRRQARQLAATAAALRAPRRAVPWGYAARYAVEPSRTPPAGWVADGDLTPTGCHEVTALFGARTPDAASSLEALTTAERQVADLVADGLTSRQIAAELFISPRTVDAHLAHIYRKLEIGSRARLAAMVVAHR
jgi:DNA-binding CsgD family transcriptional regulator/tetratricopeptide (TPR) repeat protein